MDAPKGSIKWWPLCVRLREFMPVKRMVARFSFVLVCQAMLPKEIFLSHSSRDQEFALQMVAALRNHGLAVWYAPFDILGAQQWHDEIGAALERCDWFVVILSPHSVNSTWVKRELGYALSEPRLENRIVPVRFVECEVKPLSWILPQLQIIDFTASQADGFTQLLRVWGMGFRGLS